MVSTTETARTLTFTIAASDAYDAHEQEFYRGGGGGMTPRPAGIYITGVNGHSITMGGRPIGVSTTFEDIDGGGPWTADKMYSLEIPDRTEIDFKCTGGTGNATVIVFW